MKNTKFCYSLLKYTMLAIVGLLLHTTTVNATTIQSQMQNTGQNSRRITDEDLVGRYNINYTGNVNYVTEWITGTNNGEAGGYRSNNVYNDLHFDSYANYSEYKKGVTQYYTQDRYGWGLITQFNSNGILPNSSTAVISKTSSDSKIVKAYLIWYTRDSDRLFEYYNDPVFFVTPNGDSAWIYPQHSCIDFRTTGHESYLCMSVDVTNIVTTAGYGTYGVANIPYWYQTTDTVGGRTAGPSIGSWQLVVIEESASNPVRAVKLEIGSTYAHDGYTGVITLKEGLRTRPSGNTTGQVFFSGVLAGIEETNGNRQSIHTTIYSDTMTSPLRGRTTLSGQMLKNGAGINADERISPTFVSLEQFTGNIGNNAKRITMTSPARGHWDSYFCLGMAVDLAFPTLNGQQRTTITNDNKIVTVTGGYENVTTDSDTGIGGGVLTVNLDDELTAKSSELVMTYANGTTKTITGIIGSTGKTVSFSGVDLLRKGDKCSYTIQCNITKTDDEIFYNNDALSGYLYSNGAAITGFPINKASSSSSRLNLIVKVTLDVQGSAIDNGTVSDAGTREYYEYYNVGNFADRAHTNSISRIKTPKKSGCQFMGYYTGKNGTGTQYITVDGKITSTATTFKNDVTLYAYWTPGVYAVIDIDTDKTLFYEKYTVGFFTTKVLHSNGVTYDATGQITSISSVPTARGKTFDGYFTEPNGGGVQYVLTNKVICMQNNWIKQDTYVYAKWTPIMYTITCNKWGGNGGSDVFYEYFGEYFMYNKIILTPGIVKHEYGYTGGVQTFIAPYTGTYQLVVSGAQGSNSTVTGAYGTGGKGGRSYGCVNLVQGETLYIYVGGQGSGQNGGWNGGAQGGSFFWSTGGGGGATDIRRYGTDLSNRIIVAGGGGGMVATPNNRTAPGGNGGGYSYQPYYAFVTTDGGRPQDDSTYSGPVLNPRSNFGTQTAGQASGLGGGGGYYGGRVLASIYPDGHNTIPAGEGGTGYTGGVSTGNVGGVQYASPDSISGYWSGNGQATITRSNYTTQISKTNKIDIPVANGYTFMGYYTGANGTGDKIVDHNGNIIASPDYFASNATIYAYWVSGSVIMPPTYTVRFHGNGATGGVTPSMLCNIGQTYKFNSNGYTRPNFNFLGWSTSPTGGVNFTDNQFFNDGTVGASANSIINLYAVWELSDKIPPVIYDNTPDVTNISEIETEIEYQWVNYPVHLKFTATDNIAMKSLTLYDNSGNKLVSAVDSVSYTVTTEGITKYVVKAEDTAGNKATVRVTVKIDYVAPQGVEDKAYDGVNLTASINNIIEQLSGCKKAWVVTTAYMTNGTAIRTDKRDLTIASAGNIHNGARYTGTFALEDEYNYTADYMTVAFWIRDIAGNEAQIGDTHTIDTFYLTGTVTRVLGPLSCWNAGEAGYVTAVTGAYVDKLYIKYPDPWTALDSSLGTHVFDYTGIKENEKTEKDGFFIPLYTENNIYEIEVTAEKNGHTKNVMLPVSTDGTLIEKLRTNLRYSESTP